MVCGVPFLVSLFLLTLGILILPKYPLMSPFLFFACYLIWKKSPAPGLSGYRTLKGVQVAYQKKTRRMPMPQEDFVTVKTTLVTNEETKELEKAA